MNLKRPQELCLDGIETSLAMTMMTYSRLCKAVLHYSQATSLSNSASDTRNLTLLDAWSLIDITNGLRVFVRRTPGLKHNAPVKSFLRATEDVETLRNFVQHLDGELVGLVQTGWPLWRSRSWIWASPEMQKQGEVARPITVPGRLARAKVLPMANPAGKTVQFPVDYISLSAAGTTVNLGEITRSSKLFRKGFEAALEQASESRLELRNGEREIVLLIALDTKKTDEVAD